MPDFQFQSLAEFFAMGGHALYVWSSYGVFALMIVFNIVQPILANRKIFQQLKARLAREENMAATAAVTIAAVTIKGGE